MLMPKKHIKLESSVLGASSLIGSVIMNGDTFDIIYKKATKKLITHNTNQDFILLCLDFLFAIGFLYERNGRFYLWN